MKTIRGVIFDCDGVLFESRQANLAYYNFVLTHLGMPNVREDEPDKVHLCHTADSPKVFEGLLGPELSGEALKFAATLNYRRFIPFMIPEPGMVRALAELSTRMPLAVATNRGASMPEILRHFDLVPYFSAVVTSKDVPRPKPYPDMLLKAAELLGLERDELLFVGDSDLDRIAAREAEILFAAYKGGCSGDLEIGEYGELVAMLVGSENR
ncbi:MAG: HAD family hydrolase [Desulfuromonadales bacterium]|jgi:phosphoglycolate phosphatase